MTYINLICDGSSSMVSNYPTSWLEVYKPISAYSIDALHQQAVGGSVLADLVTRLSTVTSNLHSGWNGIVCQIGANDLLPATLAANHGNSVTQWASDVVANYLLPLAAIIRSTGPVVLTTVQPRDITGFNTNRNIANPIIRGWATSGLIDGVIDMAADPVMGPDAACNNLSLYSDGTHPTQVGTNNDAVIIKTYFDPIITRTQFRRLVKIGS